MHNMLSFAVEQYDRIQSLKGDEIFSGPPNRTVTTKTERGSKERGLGSRGGSIWPGIRSKRVQGPKGGGTNGKINSGHIK